MKVYNKSHNDAPIGAVSIMRPSIWGNPYAIYRDGNRDEVCDKYREFLHKLLDVRPDILEQFTTLMQTADGLLCCCKPKRCHGDEIVAEAIERGILRA